MRRRGLLLGLALVSFAAWTPLTLAHGVLERSVPSAGAIIESAPERIVLWFSEPVDPIFSRVVLTDAGGARRGGPQAASGDGRQLALAAGALPRGVYTVAWRVMSVSDGHITTGSFAFAVGTALATSAAPVTTALPEPLRAFARWLSFLAMVALAGAVLFDVIVWRPAVRRLPSEDVLRLAGPPGRALGRLGRGAAIALLLALALECGVSAAALLDAPAQSAMPGGAVWAFLTGTKPGWGLVARGGLTITLLALLAVRDRRAITGPVAALAAAALPIGTTLASHASGVGVGASGVDWLHSIAAAAWIGGLASLVVVLRASSETDRPLLARTFVPRFSAVAGISLGVVLLTGVFGARLYAPDITAALATPYGRTLLVKVVLVAVLLGLGALNRQVIRPRVLHDSDASAPVRRFLRLSAGEVVAGMGILLVVAALTLMPPAKSATPIKLPMQVLLAGIAGDVKVRLTISPAVPGWNRLDVTAHGAQDSPIDAPARMLVRLLKLDEALDPKTIILFPITPGRFAGEGGDLAAAGWWQVEVVVRRAGRMDASTVFPLMLERPALECRPRSPTRQDAHAVKLQSDVQAAWERVRTWRETQQLTDGEGNVYLTWAEAERPDRQHFRTSTGVEVVTLGAVRYQRSSGGPWQRYEFASPAPVEGPIYFLRGARDVRLGRTGQCSGEPCRVLFWTSPDGGARFAAWVGANTARVHRLLMLEPTHYMTLQYSGVDAPVRIREPR